MSAVILASILLSIHPSTCMLFTLFLHEGSGLFLRSNIKLSSVSVALQLWVDQSELCAGRLCWSQQIVKKKKKLTRYLGKCDITGMLLIFMCENTNIVWNLSAPIWLWRLYLHYLPAQVEPDKQQRSTFYTLLIYLSKNRRDTSFKATALPVGKSFFMNAFNLVHSPSCVMYGIVVETKTFFSFFKLNINNIDRYLKLSLFMTLQIVYMYGKVSNININLL